MAMKQVQEVKTGSTVRLNGNDYVVKQNSITDLLLERGIVKIKLSNLVGAGFGKHTHSVNVVKEPQTQADLTASFRAQVAKPKESLADSFRKQVAVQSAPAFVGRDVVYAEQAKQEVAKVDIKVNAVNAKVDSVRGATAQAILSANDAKAIARDVADAFEGFAFEAEIRIGAVEQSVENLADAVEVVVEAHNASVDAVEDTVASLSHRIAHLEHERNQERLDKSLANQPKSQGGNKMKNLLGNFKGLFGKVEGQFALSVFGGVAMRKGFTNNWVTYDAVNGITDVQDNVITKFDVPAFRLPVAAADINKGDYVVNNGQYQIVTATADGYVNTINPVSASKGTVLPIRNPILGKAFYTVVKVIDFTAGATAAGGFNPMLLMALGGDGDKDSLLPLLLASGGLGGQAGAAIDPMMLAFLGDNTDDLLPLILLQQGGIAGEGFNPLMLLALGDKGGKGKDLLPLLLATQGGAGAAGLQSMLPLLMLSGDGGDMKDIFMLQALTGQNIFAPAAPVAPVDTKTTK